MSSQFAIHRPPPIPSTTPVGAASHEQAQHCHPHSNPSTQEPAADHVPRQPDKKKRQPGQQNGEAVSSDCDKLTSEGGKCGGSVASVPLILYGCVSPVSDEMGQFRQRPLHAELFSS